MLQRKKFPIRCSFGDKTLKGNKQNNDVSMESNKTNNKTTTIVMRSSSSQKRAQEDQSELENQEQII